MAYQRNPDDPDRLAMTDADLRQPSRLDSELQADPELAEGPASGARITMFAVAIALVLGAVFYGLNNSSINNAGTSPTAQTTQNSPPPAPPGMRDVTPRPNTNPGMTTGSAPAAPAPAAPAAPAPVAPAK